MPNKSQYPKEYEMKIGQNIRQWRDMKGMKQKVLAGKLGITTAALSNIENDKTDISLRRVEHIASILEIETKQLFMTPNQMYTNNKAVNDPAPGNLPPHTVDKDLMERVLSVMEKITSYFTTNDKKK